MDRQELPDKVTDTVSAAQWYNNINTMLTYV